MDLIDYLFQSECIRLVAEEKYTPEDLDNAYKNLRAEIERLRKRVRDLERQRTEQAVEIGNLLQRIQYETRCEE